MSSNHIIEYLNELRLKKTGCDVFFEIGSTTFPAHRVVLIERMEHFRSIFTSQTTKKKKSDFPLDPQIIDPQYFDEFLDYVYTLHLELTNDNIRPLYKAAVYFRFDELIEKVDEYLKNNMSIENVFLYRNISVEFHLKWLEDISEQYIIDNFASDAIRSHILSTISFEDLKSLTNELKKKDKFEEMFNYSVDWVLNDKDNRKEQLLELFENVPLDRLSYKFLKETVVEHEIIKNDLVCLKVLLKAMFAVAELYKSSVPPPYSFKPKTETLYAIGGKDGQQLSSVSEYSALSRTWTQTTPMPNIRAHFGIAAMGARIYVCGGHNGRSTINELTVFDTNTRIWTQLSPMKNARQLGAAAVLNGQVYVAGGWNGHDRQTLVERYNVQTDSWEDIAPMTIKRSELELVALNGFLYAIGGHDGGGELNTVERYDPQTNKWTPMNNTNGRYQAFGSAVLNGNIYIAGKDKCEVYTPANDKWTELLAPSVCDYGRRLAVYDGKLYVLGGLIGEWRNWKGIRTVEVFDMQARVWRTEPDMDVARCFHGVAVVKN